MPPLYVTRLYPFKSKIAVSVSDVCSAKKRKCYVPLSNHLVSKNNKNNSNIISGKGALCPHPHIGTFFRTERWSEYPNVVLSGALKIKNDFLTYQPIHLNVWTWGQCNIFFLCLIKIMITRWWAWDSGMNVNQQQNHMSLTLKIVHINLMQI